VQEDNFCQPENEKLWIRGDPACQTKKCGMLTFKDADLEKHWKEVWQGFEQTFSFIRLRILKITSEDRLERSKIIH